MSKISSSPLQQNRLSTASDRIADATGDLQRRYGLNSSITHANVKCEIADMVRSGLIEPGQLADVARDLLSRGSDWNPFNNHGAHSNSTLRAASVVVASYAQSVYGVSLD